MKKSLIIIFLIVFCFLGSRLVFAAVDKCTSLKDTSDDPKGSEKPGDQRKTDDGKTIEVGYA